MQTKVYSTVGMSTIPWKTYVSKAWSPGWHYWVMLWSFKG